MKEELKEILQSFKWTFENIGEPHNSDHFNIPANGITLLENLIEKQEALESKPVAVAWPSYEEMKEIAKEHTQERMSKEQNYFDSMLWLKATTPAIDLEDFLKWYKPNHKLFYYDELSTIMEKYNEHLKQKQG